MTTKPVVQVVGSAVALCLALSACAPFAAAASAAKLNQLEQELHTVHVNLVNDRAKIDAVSQQESVTSAQLAAVGTQIALTQSGIDATQRHIRTTQANITRTQQHLDRTVQRMHREQGHLDTVLVFAEEQGPIGYLSVLLHVSSFDDFVARLGMLADISTYERGLVHHLGAEEASMQRDLRTLSRTRATLQRQKANLVSQRSYLSKIADQRAAVLSQLRSEQASLAGLEQNLVAQGNQLWGAIRQIERELADGQLTASQLFSLVQSIAALYGVDPYLVLAVIHQESGGNSHAISSVGAEGLMQLMPQTAKDLGVTDPFNPQQNVKGGIAYLAYLLHLFKGNVIWAIAAYNAGPGAVEYYHGIPPYPETQNYVKDVMWYYNHGL